MFEHYERVIKEANIEHWENLGYLKGIEDPHIKISTSLMLQNQDLFNNICDSNTVKDSLALISKIIPKLLVNKITSIQPMLGPSSFVYYNHQTGISFGELTALTRILKTKWTEEDNVDSVAEKLIKEINFEILTDISKNCGTSKLLENSDDLYVALLKLAGTITENSFLNFEKWIVLGEETYDKHKEVIKSVKYLYHVHLVEEWDKSEILMGMKGDNFFDSSYAWCPYVMFSKTSPILSGELLPRQQFMIRYGKRLQKGGSKNFGKITWNDKA